MELRTTWAIVHLKEPRSYIRHVRFKIQYTPSERPSLIRRFFAYYRPHRGLFYLGLSFAVAVKAFIDRLLPGQNWGLIVLAGAALLVVYLLNAGLKVIVTYWGHMLGINIETEMRRKAFDHLGFRSAFSTTRRRGGSSPG